MAIDYWAQLLPTEGFEMNETPTAPLSELLDRYVQSRSKDLWEQFLALFRSSKHGVRVTGAPAGTTGDFVSTSQNPVAVSITTFAGGRPMVLAFADPIAFEQRFGCQFNGLMTGDALFSTVENDPKCEGILVNSATKEISIVIDRATVHSLLDNRPRIILAKS